MGLHAPGTQTGEAALEKLFPGISLENLVTLSLEGEQSDVANFTLVFPGTDRILAPEATSSYTLQEALDNGSQLPVCTVLTVQIHLDSVDPDINSAVRGTFYERHSATLEHPMHEPLISAGLDIKSGYLPSASIVGNNVIYKWSPSDINSPKFRATMELLRQRGAKVSIDRSTDLGGDTVVETLPTFPVSIEIDVKHLPGLNALNAREEIHDRAQAAATPIVEHVIVNGC